MTDTEIIQTMKIKSVKAAVSFWGNFRFRGDSYLEMQAECSEDGWSIEEARLIHLILAREISIECALEALTRGQFSKTQFTSLKTNIEKSFEKRKEKLISKTMGSEDASK